MPFLGLFQWMDALPSSIALRQSLNAYPILLTTHLVSMAAFSGLIAFWDMRLVGIALPSVPVSRITDRIFPWMLVGFFVAVVSGLVLFYSQPMRYYDNFYFWVKNALLVLAGLNAAVFHYVTKDSLPAWEHDPVTPPIAKFAGIASLVMWAVIIITGRMIAYSALVPEWWVSFATPPVG